MEKSELMRLLKRLRPLSKSDEKLIEQLRGFLEGKGSLEYGDSIETYVNKKTGHRWESLVPLLRSIDEKQKQLDSLAEEVRRSGPKRKRDLTAQLVAMKRAFWEVWRKANPQGPGRHKTRLRVFAENHPELNSPGKLRDAFYRRLRGGKPLLRNESRKLVALCKATLQNIRRASVAKKRAS